MRSKLGQNFLINPKILRRIADALTPGEGDTIIEIGPGHGELTRELLAHSPKRIIALERDPALRDALVADGVAQVVLGNALDTLPEIVRQLNGPYLLTGNIPYYISGHLFRTIGELARLPERAVFTVQFEVAARLAAKPPRMNRLAAHVQGWANAELLWKIKAHEFRPTPKVDSATILLTPHTKTPDPRERTRYEFGASLLFRQPRQTIKNNILKGLAEPPKEDIWSELEKQGIAPSKRPQDLSIDQIRTISRLLARAVK